mmetsp:Transcript_20869/g.66554  ORF Transcript_20869/g.66554 Transcript_20869/m.66554 type:complete len:213 (+) Transcript_20869:659-1297(+)
MSINPVSENSLELASRRTSCEFVRRMRATTKAPWSISLFRLMRSSCSERCRPIVASNTPIPRSPSWLSDTSSMRRQVHAQIRCDIANAPRNPIRLDARFTCTRVRLGNEKPWLDTNASKAAVPIKLRDRSRWDSLTNLRSCWLSARAASSDSVNIGRPMSSICTQCPRDSQFPCRTRHVSVPHATCCRPANSSPRSAAFKSQSVSSSSCKSR